MSDELTALGLVADLRKALGDPTGKLMQDELVAHAAALLAERDRLHAELEQIARVANCGSVDSWLVLPDEHKRKWFAMLADESSRKAKAIREADALRADVWELVECLAVAHRVIGPDWESADGTPLRGWHEASSALLVKHRDSLRALADNARELGLNYEDGSKT